MPSSAGGSTPCLAAGSSGRPRPRSSQEDRWAEADESVEAAERPVRHEQVDPWIDVEAAPEQVAHRRDVDAGNLELERVGARARGERLDMAEDRWEIRVVECGDR